MQQSRARKLRKNFGLLFWAKALLSLKIINVVVVLFYLHRGLDLPQVFFLSVIWAVTTIVSEIPSSYCADRWGRKRTLLVGALAYLISAVLLFFAASFALFAVSIVLYAFSYALFSGTDEALIYDTTKELQESDESLKQLGQLSSADRFLKILAPLVGAFLAQDLVESQFMILVSIDVLAALLAGFVLMRITEPNHYMDLEKEEAGIIKDGWNVLVKNKTLTQLILSRSLIFIAIFIMWRSHQEYFVQIGVSIIGLGLAWSLFNILAYFGRKYIHTFYKTKTLLWRVKTLNLWVMIGMLALLATLQFPAYAYLILVVFLFVDLVEVFRWPLYSELFNKASRSYNRATTLSLANFVKSILDIPLLFLGAWLIAIDITFPFYLTAAIVLLVILFIDQRMKTKRP